MVVAYIKEMQLIGSTSDAVREQEYISLQPRHFRCGVLETGAWAAHRG